MGYGIYHQSVYSYAQFRQRFMKFKIHRGTQEIGDSCVEIWTYTTRIVIDFWMPLVYPDRTKFNSREIKHKSVQDLLSEGILPDFQSFYDGRQI